MTASRAANHGGAQFSDHAFYVHDAFFQELELMAKQSFGVALCLTEILQLLNHVFFEHVKVPFGRRLPILQLSQVSVHIVPERAQVRRDVINFVKLRLELLNFQAQVLPHLHGQLLCMIIHPASLLKAVLEVRCLLVDASAILLHHNEQVAQLLVTVFEVRLERAEIARHDSQSHGQVSHFFLLHQLNLFV